jgi:hypothetical protein
MVDVVPTMVEFVVEGDELTISACKHNYLRKPFKLLCHAFRCKDRGIVGMVQLRYDSMVTAHLLKLMNSIEHLVAAC